MHVPVQQQPCRAPLTAVAGRTPIRPARRVPALLVPALTTALLAALGTAPAPTLAQQAAVPPPSVVVAAVVSKTLDRASRYVGTVQAIESVDVKARVEGYLEKVAFEQGGAVTVGQLLYQIDQAPFQADLESAKAQVAAAKAELDSAKARLAEKEADFARQSALIKKGDTSQTAFDQSRAARDEAIAAVASAQASQQQAAAAQRNAEINLGYTTINSPINGRIGATNETAGNLVGPNTGTLATVAQLDPIRVVFSVPSAAYVRFQQRVNAGGAADNMKVQVLLPTGQTYEQPGTIQFADNQVNAATGTIAVYADFPNSGGLLLPGQYVTALLAAAEEIPLPTIPAAALMRTRDGEQVYVLGADNRVEVRAVQSGPAVGAELTIHQGLTDGEIVIVSGLQKVKAGMQVTPVQEAPASP